MTLPKAADTKTAKYWQDKLDELSRTELDTIRGTAAKWQGTISTLLGIFGTVAFVGSASAIDKLSPGAATIAKIAVTGAVVLAVLAVLSATYAAQGLPGRKDNPDWVWLENQSREQAGRSLVALRVSQGLAIVAMVVVIVGSVLVLWGSPARSAGSAQSVLVRLGDGTVRCGELVSAQGVTAIRVAPETTLPFDASTQLLGTVSACP